MYPRLLRRYPSSHSSGNVSLHVRYNVTLLIGKTSSDIWLTAEAFGVHCLPEVTKDVTHCVTATLGTEKTYRAGKIRGAKVVWVGWFWKSVALWSRQDEEDFLAGQSGLASTSGPNTPTIVVDEPTGDGLEEGNGDEDVGEEADGAGWDEDAQAELDAFLERSSDVDETEGGRTDAERYVIQLRIDRDELRDRSVPSPPGTPSRKRVRYADEEQLPLESFKDPSPPE
jgi:RNA polymerase II subunit A-like phosphatase